MTYEQVQTLKPEAFKRFCGVHRSTFTVMVEVLEQKRQEKRKPGRPSKLSLEDQLLLTLQYWREYRTYFHLAQNWQVNESTAFRIVRQVEQTLIRSGRFSLPGKKALVQPDAELVVTVVDVTESPVERPKKTTAGVLWQEKAAHAEVPVGREPADGRNNLHCSWVRTRP